MLAGLAVDAVVSATLVETVGEVVDGTALDKDELTSTRTPFVESYISLFYQVLELYTVSQKNKTLNSCP